MICVGVRFENPLHFELVLFDVINYFCGRRRSSSSRLWVVVQNRVNDGAGCAFSLVDDVGDGPSGFVKYAVDDGFQARGGHYMFFN